MSGEFLHCQKKAILSADGFRSRSKVALETKSLTVELGASIWGEHYETPRGYGFRVEAGCTGFRDGTGHCGGICLQAALERLGLSKVAKVEGACAHESKP